MNRAVLPPQKILRSERKSLVAVISTYQQSIQARKSLTIPYSFESRADSKPACVVHGTCFNRPRGVKQGVVARREPYKLRFLDDSLAGLVPLPGTFTSNILQLTVCLI